MKLAILGSTGSIGRQTLDVISHYLKDEVQVVALSANTNVELLKKQSLIFKPKYVCITNKIAYDAFDIPDVKKVRTLKEIVDFDEINSVLTAVVGISGLEATVEALKKGKRIYLANKETLVAGGEYIKAHNWIKNIIPIDSEHSAIFQSLTGEDKRDAKRIIITASGGALRDWEEKDLYKATIDDVLNHPTWSMGKKVTIDSATMVNKGLEIMEAYYLFGIDDILPLIHKQSIIHSMVEYVDGSIKAQLAISDMRLPILYALTYPRRIRSNYFMDFSNFIHLTFEPMNYKRYPAIKLAEYVLKQKGILPVVYNASNEIAVEKFISGSIKFIDIYKIIEKVVLSFKNISNPSIDDIISFDQLARVKASEVSL